ncbi:hypothetical protein AAXB25_15215 [Paenibacillus lautus]|uniref:hypothetical protein n=1 Tax=Paenibacillus lautus TaxID=1401 RepID=UPI003D26A293
MKYGQREVIELTVYDTDGNKVSHLDTLKDCSLDDNGLFLSDSLVDFDFLKFIGRVESKSISDYEAEILPEKYSTTIVFNKSASRFCKLTGKGLIRSQDSGLDVEFLFEIPNAEIKQMYRIQANNEVTIHDFYFKIHSYNSQGDTYKIHI